MSQKVASVYAEYGMDVSGLKRGLGEAKEGLSQAKEQAGLFGTGLVVTAGDIYNFATKALAAGKEMMVTGNAIDQVHRRLLAFTGSAQEATRTTELMAAAANHGMSQFDTERIAVDLLGRGLASNAEEAARLTRIGLMLGDATLSATDRMSNFSLLLANQSIQRLDTFGLSAAMVRERMQQMADAAGDSQETMKFFTQAVLELGEQRLGKLEAAGVEAASSLDQLDAIVKDNTNKFKEWVASGLLPAVEAVVTLANWNKTVSAAYAEAREEIDDSAGSYQEYTSRIYYAAQAAGELTDYQVSLIEAYIQGDRGAREYSESVVQLMRQHGIASQTAWEATQAERAWGEQRELLARNTQRLIDMQQAEARAALQAKAALIPLTASISEVGASYADASGKASDFGDNIDIGIASKIDNAYKQMQFLAAGGLDIIDTFDRIMQNEFLSPEQKQSLLGQLAVETADLSTNLGWTQGYQAAQDLKELMGPEAFKVAKTNLDGVYDILSVKKAVTHEMQIAVNFSPGSSQQAIDIVAEFMGNSWRRSLPINTQPYGSGIQGNIRNAEQHMVD